MPSFTKTSANRRDRARSYRAVSARATAEVEENLNSTDQKSDIASPMAKSNAFMGLIAKPTPVWKRTLDCVVAGVLLVFLSPLLVLISLYIRAVSRGPVLFTQSRLGLMGDEFTIYKFRTLKCSSTATSDHKEYVAKLSATDGVLTKPDLSSRVIPGGRLLRQTSLDELPQLLNILLGNMSLIGPRPDVMYWSDYKPEQLRRFEVVPGVTGLWQVSGKNRLTFEQMIEKDVYYVDHRSVKLDLWILLKTFGLLLQRDNK
jgi:lipopolysaccharide/colanic/teichoic acid biosynthesis glycosyltransferase